MTDFPRLIEHAFPLKQTSLDSVHEKNVRHGHISTLHIWPARRPLAACRAALIATLLPDPSAEPKPAGMSDDQWQREIVKRRQELCEKIGGKVVRKIEKKTMPSGQIVERIKEETEGGVLHWGRETENIETLEWFRKEIRRAYGNVPPKVVDPFAGGGAIPLEAMRLGCTSIAVDINPVAWFIEKCTLDYPQKLAGKAKILPSFVLTNDDFMQDYFAKGKGYSKAEVNAAMKRLHDQISKQSKAKRREKDQQKSFQFVDEDVPLTVELQADLAWHVRAWGRWVLDRVRAELAEYYPVYAEFEPIKKDKVAYELQPMQLVPVKIDGTADIDLLNSEFSDDYLDVKSNPRWIAKQTVAYLWARTVNCKNCRSTIPLLKTRWLCKKKDGRKRVLLTMEPNSEKSGVIFGIQAFVPAKGGNAAQKREHDKKIGAGTMSGVGVKCPCCNAIMTMEDLRIEGKSGRLGLTMTAVAVEGQTTKEYRLPTELERTSAVFSNEQIVNHFSDLPLGPVNEPMPDQSALGMRAPKYGIDSWNKMFTDRQLVSLARITTAGRSARKAIDECGIYDPVWAEAIISYLACGLDRLVDFANVNVQWKVDADTINHAMVRFAIQMTWDFAEGNPIGSNAGAYLLCINRIATALDTLANLPIDCEPPIVINQTAERALPQVDLVFTDPPYYDAIPYSDLMDWFYVWLRRHVKDLSEQHEGVMSSQLGPKWGSSDKHELIDDPSRHGGDKFASKKAYEDGMSQCFTRCNESLTDGGILVIVFANKSPDAWETLVAAVIRAGFIVNGSWPIQTEQPSRMRGLSSAALASSVWLICKKRPVSARPGWDSNVLEEMRRNISTQLRDFWDAGIRGPDFVWAATGPAMEAYSKHPVVRKANEPNATMSVGEFLNHVRRMVVDYVVGQVLSGVDAGSNGGASAGNLDEVTAYYLLHRHDFGTNDAPVGACILYATACGLSDTELERTWDILLGGGRGSDTTEDDEEEADSDDGDGDIDTDPDADSSGGSKVKLKAWNQRRSKSMGYDAPEGKAVPLIDRIHRLMHLWKDGDLQKVDEYIDEHALRRNELFKRVVQSLIELSTNSERSTLESISNHIGAKGAVRDRGPTFDFGDDE